jgi:hypothetical protein
MRKGKKAVGRRAASRAVVSRAGDCDACAYLAKVAPFGARPPKWFERMHTAVAIDLWDAVKRLELIIHKGQVNLIGQPVIVGSGGGGKNPPPPPPAFP